MKFELIGSLVKKTKQCEPKSLDRGLITYIDISSVDRITKQITQPHLISVDKAPSRARKQVYAHDVIVSTVRPNLNAVARVPKQYDNEIASTGFCILRADENFIDSLYLFYFTQTNTFISNLTKLSIGAGYPAVSDDDILDTEIPLPPLAEQKRIAAILEKANGLRRTRRYAQQLSDTFLQSVFLEMFGEYLKQESPKTPLDELVTISGGGTPSREVTSYYQGNIPWITPKDMLEAYITDAQEYITEKAIKDSATKLVPKGSILIVVKSKVLMHRLPLAIAKRELCHNQDIKSIQCSKKVNSYFLLYILKYNEPQLLRQARGANTEGLTLPMLEAVLVPNVSLSIQEQFAQIVHKFERLRTQQQEAERQAEHLFQTLLYRAFRGEL